MYFVVQYLVGGSPLSTKVLGGCRLRKGEKAQKVLLSFFLVSGYKGSHVHEPGQAKPSFVNPLKLSHFAKKTGMLQGSGQG